MNRGAGRRMLFADNGERRYFVRLLAELEQRFGIEVHAYCLMGNHFHLLVRSTEGSLSAAMQYLSANFTRHVNHWRNVDGPIFRGRFHSVPVVEPEHLQVLVRYIHRNPLGTVPAGRLGRYPWSSLPALLGLRAAPGWLHRATVLGWFGDDVEHLARFVTAEECSLELPDWLAEESRRVAGAPVEAVTSDAGQEWPAPMEVVSSLELKLQALGVVAAGELRHSRPGARNTARLAVVFVAREDHGVEVADLAARYGVSGSYVRSAATRARRRYGDDPEFRDFVDLLRTRAAA